MNRLVDRQRELQRLQQVATAPPALVVLRGRRRVGKSYLLRSALSGPRVLSFQAEQQPLPLQLVAFAREGSRLLPGAPAAPHSLAKARKARSARDLLGAPTTISS